MTRIAMSCFLSLLVFGCKAKEEPAVPIEPTAVDLEEAAPAAAEAVVQRVDQPLGDQHRQHEQDDLEQVTELHVVAEHDVDGLEDDELAAEEHAPDCGDPSDAPRLAVLA